LRQTRKQCPPEGNGMAVRQRFSFKTPLKYG
jgi:hypothetical protein